MNLQQRNNVHVMGEGRATLIFSHGFGCDQAMWRLLSPHYADRFKVMLYDLVGAGNSAIEAYDRNKYATLNGYAHDLTELIHEFATGPVIIVGHSVSAMIGVLADRQTPGLIAAHVMIGPAPATLTPAITSAVFPKRTCIRCSIRWTAITSAGRAPWPR